MLKDISLEIPENTMTAFVGSSGAGKTTLAMLIARFWDVGKGSIFIGGRDVRDYTLESLMSHISVVFLYMPSVFRRKKDRNRSYRQLQSSRSFLFD